MKQLYKCVLAIFVSLFASYEADAQATAAFNIIAPSPACNPAVVSFVDASTGVAPLTYDWNFGVYAGTNSIFQNPSTTYLTCGTYTVQLIVTDGNGDSDTTTQNITIYCSPIPDFSVNATSGCTPFDVTFTDNSTPGSGTIQTLTWDFGDGYLGSGDSITHSYTAVGCNTVTQIVTNSFGCTADTTLPSFICTTDQPTASFTSSTSIGCASPFNVAFNGNVTGGTGPYTYAWTFENGTPSVDSTTNPSVDFYTAGGFDVTLTVTDVNGCISTVTQTDYVQIAANSVDISANSFSGCAPFQFDFTAVTNNTPQSYSWSVVETGQTATGQNTSFTFNIPGTYNICLDVTFSGGCTAQKCTTVVVHALPTANFVVSGNATTCIRPSQLTFTNLSTGDTLSYNWSFPGGSPSASADTTPVAITYVSCGTFNASLIVTDVNGCTASASQNNMFTITCPYAGFTADVTGGCAPLTVTFGDSSIGSPVQWEWDFGDGTTGTGLNPSHTFNNEGCYTVTLITTTVEGCKDTTTIVDFVCVGTPPIVDFTSNPPVACADEPISFFNNTTNTFPYTTYVWDFVGVPPYDQMSTLPDPLYVYNDTGWFDVTLIASNYGCNDTLTIDSMEHILPPVAIPTLTRNCDSPLVVLLSGTQSLGADTYTWVIPGGNPSSATTPTVSVTYTASGNYSATLYVTNATTGCDNQSSINIAVRDVEADFTGTPLSGCATLNSCMTNQSVDGVSYAWLVTNAATGATVTTSTQTNPCFSLTNAGVYNVRLIATDMFGCRDTMYKPSYITVWRPTAAFYATPLQGCTPLFVQFTDTSYSLTSTIVSWSWNFGDPASGVNNTSTLQNPSHTYNNPGLYTVSLTVTDDHGCTRTVTKTNYINVVQPNADFLLSNTNVCPGAVSCFTNASSGTGLTYAWDFGNGMTSTSAAPCIAYADTGSYNVSLIVTDTYGCVDTTIKANYIVVTDPLASFIADTTNSTCPPLLVQFDNQSTGAISYNWNFGDGSVSSAPDPQHIYNVAGTYNVTLIATNADGCKDTLVLNNYIVIGGPQASVSAPVTSGCAPFTTCFQAFSSTSISYTWNLGDGTVTVDDDSICYTYYSPGVYNAELILNDGVGCIYAIPVGQINVDGAVAHFLTPNNPMCGAGNMTFQDSSWSYVGINSHTWDFGDPASGVSNTSTATNPTHFYTTPGTYVVTLTVTSIDGCTSSTQDSVVIVDLPIAAFSTNDSTLCLPANFQFTDLSSSTSGIATYNWEFGDGDTSTTQNPNHSYLASGVYTVTLTVTDSNGCSASTTLPLQVSPGITVDAGADQIICVNGSIALNASGADIYQWTPSSGLSSSTVSNPIANPTITTTYTLVGTSFTGCTAIDSVVVSINSLPQVDTIFATPDNCATSSASATVVTSNGTVPYSYLWNNGGTDATITNIPGGLNYSVTVTDAIGCTATDSIDVIQLLPASITYTSQPSTCGLANGSVNITITGGTAPFTFAWSNGDTTEDINALVAGTYTVTVIDAVGCTVNINCAVNGLAAPTVSLFTTATTCGNNNGAVYATTSGNAPFTYLWNTSATTQNIINQSAGSYSVTVTDINGCTVTGSATVNAIAGLSLSETHVNTTCGLSNGSIDLTVVGGTAPFQFAWNTNYAFTEDLSNVAGGSYTVIVTDANLCTATLTVNVTSVVATTITTTASDASCGLTNGSVTTAVANGTAPYTYVWSTGETTADLTNVGAGIYTVTVTTSDGCTATTTATVNNISAPAISLTTTAATCGTSNGTITMTISGGVSPFTFAWSNGATTQNLASLAAGTYNVTVTASNGCSAVGNIVVTATIAASLSYTATSATCNAANGSIILNVSGGASPYTFLWSNSNTTQNNNNVLPGTYTVTVTTAGGCTSTLTAVVGNVVGVSPTLSYTSTNSTCNSPSGSVNLSISSGVAPFTYVWSTGATTQNLTGVTGGTYTVTVTGANGCSSTLNATVNFTNTLIVSVNSGQSHCNNPTGPINAVVSGTGTGPFSYQWNFTNVNDNHFNGLPPGYYSVTVTDINGCTATGFNWMGQSGQQPDAQFTSSGGPPCQNQGAYNFTGIPSGGYATDSVHWLFGNGNTASGWNTTYTYPSPGVYTVTEIVYGGLCTDTMTQVITIYPTPLTTAATIDVACNVNGAIDLTVTTGSSPWTYSWSNGATTQDIPSASSGTYTVTVTESHGCTGTGSYIVGASSLMNLAYTSVNSTCGNANGSITTNVTSGAPPYTYIWSTGATTTSISNLLPGNYTVTVTDSTNCALPLTVNITDNLAPTLTLTKIDAACGQSIGSIDLSTSGGAIPFTYLWSNGATTQDLTNEPAGAYSVTVTDVNGCTSTIGATLNDQGGPVINATSTPAACNQPIGGLQGVVSFGNAPFAYTWSDGSTTQNVVNVIPGTYTLSVTDVFNCLTIDTVVVVNTPGPSLTYTQLNTICGNANGQIDLSVASGTAPFTYNWNSGAYNTEDLNTILAGTYTVVVTDAYNCQATDSVNITDTPGPSAVTLTGTNADCGFPNGSINSSVTGGTLPYTYAWSNGSTNSSLSNVVAGTYNLTVTDANGCTITNSVIVGNNPAQVVTLAATPLTCSVNNGLVDATITGGVATYAYIWSNGETTEDISNLSANTYSITVTDARGCTASAMALVDSVYGPYLAYTITSTTCNQDNGAVDVTVLGGTAPFQYDWNSGTYASQDINNLAVGSYTLVLTDANNCVRSVTAVIDAIAVPTIQLNYTSATCGFDNGTATVSVNGLTGPYTYQWDDTNNSIDSFAVNLYGDITYSVTVTDSNSCTITDTVFVPNIAGPVATTVNTIPVCSGNSSGAIDLTVAGGTSPFTFDWNSGQYNTEDISGLIAGTYIVVVTDSNNCQAIAVQAVDTFVTPVIILAATNPLCSNADGIVVASVSSGTSPYTYNWNTGDTTNNISSLATGTYFTTVTDANGCSISDSVVLTTTPAVTAVAVGTDASCNQANGLVDLTVNTGTTPYTFNWNNAATTEDLINVIASNYDVTVTDSAGCTTTVSATVGNTNGPTATYSVIDATCGNSNGSIDITITGGTLPYTYTWNTSDSTEDIINIAQGVYDVTVSDATGCQTSLNITVNNIGGPTAAYTIINSTCGNANGAADILVTGGTAPYTFTWSDASTNEDIDSVFAGTYAVTVIDSNTCQTSLSFPIANVSGAVFTLVPTNSNCGATDGSIDLTPFGGIAPYTFNWSNGNTTEDISNIPAGMYSVTLTDANSCATLDSIAVSNNGAATITIASTATTCNNANGSLDATVTGGASPYTYNWDNGATTEDINALVAGSYTLSVTDINGCLTIQNALVDSSTLPIVTATSTSESCSNANGTITLNITNGTLPFTFNWSNSSTDQNIDSLTTGNYTVTLTDSNGCTVTSSAFVGSLLSPELTILSIDATCEQANGSANLDISGNGSTYLTLWSNGSTNEDLVNVDSGTYTVTVTDSLGCQGAATATINTTQSPDITYSVTQPTCGVNNGAITTSVTNGQPAYTYNWNTGATTSNLSNIGQGIYTLVVTDASGCIDTTTVNVNPSNGPTLIANALPDTVCAGGSITLSASGAQSYTWSPSMYLNQSTGDTVIATLTSSTTFTVTGLDSIGCIATQQVSVTVHQNPIITIVAPANICNGATAQLSVNGIGNYTWSGDTTIQIVDSTTVNVSPSVTTTYYVNTTDNFGCSAQDSTVVTVNPLPAMVVTSDNPGLCIGEQSNLTAAGATTYQWAPNTGLILMNDSTAVASPNVSTTYTITGTTSFGCTDTATIALSVFPTPILTVTPPNPTICLGSSTVMTASGADIYSWSPNTGLSATTGDQVTASPTAQTMYTVIGTNADGCTASATAVVFIGTNLTLSLSPGSSYVCYGSSTSLQVMGAEQYTWTPSTTFIDSVGSIVLVSPTISTTYTVMGYDAAGCSGQTTAIVDVIPLPSVTTNNATVCPGTTAMLYGNGADYYQWFPSTGLNNNFADSVIASPSSTTTYTVYGTTLQGCMDTAQAIVTVMSSPVASFTGLNTTYCQLGDTTTLVGTPTGGVFTGSGMVGNVFNPAIAGVGIHQVVYSYNGGFGCTASDTQTVEVFDNPVVTVDTSSICYGSQITLSAYGAATYTWNTTANIISTNSNTITLQPDSNALVVVIGTNASGCSDTTQTIVTVNPLPVADFTGLNSSYCVNGTSVTLTGSPAGGVFSGNGISGNTFNPQIAGNGTHNITYTFTDANGCSDDTTKSVTINALPVVTSTNSSGICDGDSMLLTATGAYSYSWSPSTGLSNTTGSSVIALPTSSITYTIIGTDGNGCTAQSQSVVNVGVIPVLTAANAHACQNASGVLMVNGASSYTWSPATGLNQSTGNIVLAQPSNTTTYTVVGTSSQGCTASVISVFTVDTIPVVTIDPVNPVICSYTTLITLTGYPQGGEFSGPGVNGNSFYPQVAGVGGPYNITYQYSDGNGCASAAVIPVNVYAQPNVTVNNATVCSGDPATLSAAGASTYTWLPPTSLSDTLGQSVISFTTNLMQYTVTGTSIDGCTASATALVNVSPTPQLTINEDSLSLCQGSTFTFVAGGANTYAWSPNIGLSSVTTNQVDADPTANVTYTLVGTNGFGCTDTLQVPVVSLVTPVVVTTPDAQICEGGSAQLSVTGTGSYQWVPSTGLNDTQSSSPVSTPAQSITYTVTVTASNNCTASDEVVVAVFAGANIVADGGGLVCFGETKTLHASGGFNYEWTPDLYLNTTTGSQVNSTPLDNITYTVTATNSIGCSANDTVEITVKQPLQLDASPDTRLCHGESYQLNAVGTGLTYEWSPKNSLDNPYIQSPYATPEVTTTYTVTTTDNICFTVTATTVVDVSQGPDVNTSDDVTVIAGSGQQLFATGGGTYAWTPATGLSCTDCSDPYANPTEPTTYTVTVTDSAGCRRDADIVLDFLCSEDGIYIPNTFTPNGDGKNDIFRIRGYGIKELTVFRVFNRWGELVFETTDMEKGWDGIYKNQPQFPAVYVYYVEGICANDQLIVKKGNVTLMR